MEAVELKEKSENMQISSAGPVAEESSGVAQAPKRGWPNRAWVSKRGGSSGLSAGHVLHDADDE